LIEFLRLRVIGEDEMSDLAVIGEGGSERVRLTVSLHRLRVILMEPRVRVRLKESEIECESDEDLGFRLRKSEIEGKRN